MDNEVFEEFLRKNFYNDFIHIIRLGPIHEIIEEFEKVWDKQHASYVLGRDTQLFTLFHLRIQQKMLMFNIELTVLIENAEGVRVDRQTRWH
jgi:hypothetical protein